MLDVAQQIETLRRYRAAAHRDLSIANLVSTTANQARRTQKKLGDLAAAWHALVPPHLADHTSLTDYRGGVLHATVDCAASMFELDRLLRSGLLADLRREFSGTLVRVKLRVAGTIEHDGFDRRS